MNALAITLIAAAVIGNGDDEDRPEAEPIVVTCKAGAEVRGTDIQLRDLASVKTADTELTSRLLGVSFGRRPAAGFHRVLSRQDILLRLVREGVPAERLRLDGAAQTVIEPRVTLLRPADLLDVAEPVLQAVLALEDDAGEIEYEAPTNLRTLRVPPGRASFDLVARLRDGRLGFSSALIELRVLVDEQEYKVVRLPFKLRRFQRVLVTVAPIKQGAPLGEHNLELRRVTAMQGTSPFLNGNTAVAGKVAARDLRAGTRLTLGMLADPAVVRRGDAVDVISRAGRVMVATRGVALQDGAVGARILAQNLTSGRSLPVVVRGPGVVVVTNGQGVAR